MSTQGYIRLREKGDLYLKMHRRQALPVSKFTNKFSEESISVRKNIVFVVKEYPVDIVRV